MKKVTAIFLSLLLVFGCLSVTAFAEEPAETGAAVCALAGDVDNDGFVKSNDARLALRYAVKLESDEDLLKYGPAAVARCELDGDEAKISAADARKILRLAVKLDAAPAHKTEKVTADARWTAAGTECDVCVYCGETVGEPAKSDSKLDAIVAEANAFAKDAGIDGLVKGVSENEGKDLTLEVNVDAIWEGISVPDGAFNGLLTKLGAYVNEKFADAVITLDGETVYNGKLLNTLVKKAIFSVFSGFFYKIATTLDGVYGKYALTVDGEAVSLTVKMTGSEANIAKVQSFAQVIADHVWADTTGTDLKIGIEMPDALMNTVNAHGGIERVNATQFGVCLAYLQGLDLADVIGSQQSAVNKLCATVCGLDAFVNKVIGKVTAATVTVGDQEIDILAKDAVFAPESDDYAGLLTAVTDMLSADVKGVVLGDLYNAETGTYEVPVNITVDVGNADLFTNGLISETIIFVVNP